MIRSVAVSMNADITKWTIPLTLMNGTKNKQTKKQKEKKKNGQPEGLYIPGSSMLVFSRTLLDS